MSIAAIFAWDECEVARNTVRFDSPGVRETAGEFASQEELAIIRHRIDLRDMEVAADALVFFRFSLDIRAGRATHVSVVNATVSDGAIWEIAQQDQCGTFTLSAIVRRPLQCLTIYINVAGPSSGSFRVRELLVRPVLPSLKVAFIVDPLVERGQPEWKSDYLWWFGKLDNCLRDFGVDVRSHYVTNEFVADLWHRWQPHVAASHCSIATQDLMALFESSRNGQLEQRQPLESVLNRNARTAHVELLRQAVPFEPDIVFSMSDMEVLKEAFPRALVLFRDAMYCRAPFPDELTSFDPRGTYSRASIPAMLADTPRRAVPASFKDAFFPKRQSVADLLHSAGLKDEAFLLLPLQDSRHVNFFGESQYSEQMDLVLGALRRYPDRELLVVQHPDHIEIRPDDMQKLCRSYPNLRYIRELEDIANPSAQVLPFAQGVIGVSTGILLQALLLGKQPHFMGQHGLKSLISALDNDEDYGRIGNALLERTFASYRYIFESRWLWTRINVLGLWNTGNLPADALAIDLPANIIAHLMHDRRADPADASEGLLALQRAGNAGREAHVAESETASSSR